MSGSSETPPSPQRFNVDLATVLPVALDLRNLEYVSEYDRHLACPICRCPFIDPVRLSCDHTYCRLCYRRTLQNQFLEAKTCPTCRRVIEDDTAPVPRFVTHMIDDLVVKCFYADGGCDKLLSRGEVQNHVDHYCQYAPVPCPSSDCARKIARNVKAQRCFHEAVACIDCHAEMMELELDEHLTKRCTMRSLPCVDCEADVLRCDSEQHQVDCPAAVVTCTGASIGCSFQSKRRAIQYHLEKCPMAAMAPHMKNMNRRIDNQAAMLRALQTKNDLLESSFATMQTLLEDTSPDTDALRNFGSIRTSTTKSIRSSEHTSEDPALESAAHHVLSLHESLREELDRVSAAISDVDGRASMNIINETLRIRDEMAHQNAVISSIRMQLQWLTSARLQSQSRSPASASTVPGIGAQGSSNGTTTMSPAQPVRRLSDPSRQETKL